ncbi:hypothetical protein Sya03_44580 [Spirilliplanes yamanashiensis]|uniref:Uncharacterized protein n=1 Tax=Spirilliplanes yamanashiensis TaxID=42233 RepID=A0A8J3YAK9_9ACTN|nr:hypothetical protein Sya03_44580 [Spirilliplanes yamanashiensis]
MQVAELLAAQQQVLRAVGLLGDHLVGDAAGEPLQAEQGGLLDVVVVAGHLVHRDAEHLRDLGVGRGAAQGRRQLLPGAVDAAGAAAHRAAGPVLAAQLVEQGAADADSGVAVEGDAPLRVEGAGRAQQGGESGGAQVVGVDVRRNPGEQLPDQVPHHGHVVANQFLDLARVRRGDGEVPGVGGALECAVHVVLLFVRAGGLTG